ncbi:MAG: DUF4031 domain-containing protein [Deltaproteobacteria bacterium]|nr:DUF4031 domain-containing protein [Deltaproteobacteria bacterium]
MITTPAARHGNRWSHMFADDIGELHLFARGIGLKREYFQDKPIFPHYDVTPSKRNQAILRGAKIKEVITFLREKRDANKEHQVKQL